MARSGDDYQIIKVSGDSLEIEVLTFSKNDKPPMQVFTDVLGRSSSQHYNISDGSGNDRRVCLCWFSLEPDEGLAENREIYMPLEGTLSRAYGPIVFTIQDGNDRTTLSAFADEELEMVKKAVRSWPLPRLKLI